MLSPPWCLYGPSYRVFSPFRGLPQETSILSAIIQTCWPQTCCLEKDKLLAPLEKGKYNHFSAGTFSPLEVAMAGFLLNYLAAEIMLLDYTI